MVPADTQILVTIYFKEMQTVIYYTRLHFYDQVKQIQFNFLKKNIGLPNMSVCSPQLPSNTIVDYITGNKCNDQTQYLTAR